MDEWEVMFRGAGDIVPSAESCIDGLRRAAVYARNHPKLFDGEFWGRVERHDWKWTLFQLEEWATEALEALHPKEGWDFIVLELGDCPELFCVRRPDGQALMSEAKFRDMLLRREFFEYLELAQCFPSEVTDATAHLRGAARKELFYCNVRLLSDSLLYWGTGEKWDHHGNDGYFVWLVLASLALLSPLRDPYSCERILQGRDRLYIMSGFEALFTYLATVTPQGVRFERTSARN